MGVLIAGLAIGACCAVPLLGIGAMMLFGKEKKGSKAKPRDTRVPDAKAQPVPRR